MNMCAPGKYDSKNNTCFTLDQLVEMAKAYNKYVTKEKLAYKSNFNANVDLIKIKEDKQYLLSEFKKHFEKICGGNEMCLTKQAFMNELVKNMRNDILQNTFRSEGPLNPTEWLATGHINKLMKQYENVYPDFKFMGAVPLDCNDVSVCSLYKLDFEKLHKKGINKIGVVFNHDKYGSPGSHWVALYIDINNGEINFCDSAGNDPIQNINTVISQFKNWYKKTYGENPTYKSNSKTYQMDSSECGVYSSNFIIRRLAGENFDDIIKHSLNFPQINSCRNVYFNNGTSKYKISAKCDPTISMN